MNPPPIPPLGRKVVVEPLDAERLTRIERAVVSRAVDAAPARAPRSWVGLAAAIGATALAAGVVGWLAHGRVAPAGPGPAPAPAVAAVELAPLSVRTDAQASVVDLGDATIASSPATAFVVTRPGGGVLVDMARGKVELEVGKRGARPPLVVRAGDTDVIVVGTHFTVDCGDGHGEVDVRVREGRVRIVRQQHETFVASGEEWTSTDGLVASEDLLGRAGSGDGSAAAGLTSPAGRAAGGVAIAIGPGPQVLHDRVPVVPEVHPAPRVTAPAAPSPDTVIGPHGEQMTPGAKKMLEDAQDPHAALYAAIRGVALREPLDAGTTDAAAQAAAYRAIAFPTSSTATVDYKDASAALYSLALVQATRLGRTGEALTTIDAYLRRFTHGDHLGAILWLQLRIHCLDRKWDSACHAAATSYLDKATNGAGAHVAELITQTD